MKLTGLKMTAAVMSCISMLLSPVALATSPHAISHDVVLQEGGVLVGHVIDAEGSALVKTEVTLENQGQEVLRLQTDASGNFSVNGMQGGVYKVASRGHENVVRVWAPNTAPPAAQQALTMVVGNDVVRAQYGNSPGPFTSIAQWVAEHPIMTAGLVAAGIAIPIAVDDDDPPATP